MKIPKEIVGRNKVRDAAICLEWERLIDDSNYPTIESIKLELSKRFKFTQYYIYKIVRRNNAYIPLDKEWEKRKRVTRLRIEIKKKTESNKDVADLMEQLRREIEGDKPTIDQSQHIHLTTVKALVDEANIIKRKRIEDTGVARPVEE